ncbi:MAG: hypothetical protein D8M59_00300 [Planctomycetes bacterium]|nr:hypothetical protein [Planctomycetota bacterium]NOG54838.1 hypothetical protein [Planctomycetota bacterium]
MGQKPISPKPNSFASDAEADYWHTSQDIAYRAGMSLVLDEGSTWLVSPDKEREHICTPADPKDIWFETWCQLEARYPLLSRLWSGGTAITKPGEMEHRQRRKQTE